MIDLHIAVMLEVAQIIAGYYLLWATKHINAVNITMQDMAPFYKKP